MKKKLTEMLLLIRFSSMLLVWPFWGGKKKRKRIKIKIASIFGNLRANLFNETKWKFFSLFFHLLFNKKVLFMIGNSFFSVAGDTETIFVFGKIIVLWKFRYLLINSFFKFFFYFSNSYIYIYIYILYIYIYIYHWSCIVVGDIPIAYLRHE